MQAKKLEDRRCLFCQAVPPETLPTDSMTYDTSIRLLNGWHSPSVKPSWYSNALISQSGEEVRFFLCPAHLHRVDEAWKWAKTGD